MSRLDEELAVRFSDCGTCVHLISGRCSAFPNGIPAEIWDASTGHREVRPDQTGDSTYEEAAS